jgi:hypothetical protein
VWLRSAGFPTFGDVYGAQIHRDGTITHATFPINVTDDDVFQPEVASLLDGASGAREYLVVFSPFDSYTATGRNVSAAVVRGATVLSTADVHSQVDLATIAADQQQPSADSDGQHFLLVYAHRSAGGPSNDDLRFADVLVSGGTARVCESGAVSATADREWNGRVSCAHSGGGPALRSGVAWDRTDVAGGGTPDVHGALVDGGLGGCVTPQCFGDGSGAACPSGNSGTTGRGCANSIVPAGALLGWSGDARVSADTLVLIGSGMPNSSCLYFQGTSVLAGGSGSAFGDGLRCAGGSVIRLGTKTNAASGSQYPVVGDPAVSVRGLVPASGATRWYQVWYRNAAAYCTASTFNLSSALRVAWAP